ncbi:MAG: hypothetical protein GX347_06025 [Epulopiscium sp.]|nr:hypothetical protein [Candidatus Epulonipiscium sp.]
MKRKINKKFYRIDVLLFMIGMIFLFINCQNIQMCKNIYSYKKQSKQWEREGLKRGFVLKDQIQLLQEEYENKEKLLPLFFKQKDIIQVIQELEQKIHIIFTSIYFHDIESCSIQKDIILNNQKVDLSFVGTTDQFQNLCYEIQHMNLPVKIEYCYLSQEADKQIRGTLNCTFYGFDNLTLGESVQNVSAKCEKANEQ